jgi:hypothetical protein
MGGTPPGWAPDTLPYIPTEGRQVTVHQLFPDPRAPTIRKIRGSCAGGRVVSAGAIVMAVPVEAHVHLLCGQLNEKHRNWRIHRVGAVLHVRPDPMTCLKPDPMLRDPMLRGHVQCET